MVNGARCLVSYHANEEDVIQLYFVLELSQSNRGLSELWGPTWSTQSSLDRSWLTLWISLAILYLVWPPRAWPNQALTRCLQHRHRPLLPSHAACRQHPARLLQLVIAVILPYIGLGI